MKTCSVIRRTFLPAFLRPLFQHRLPPVQQQELPPTHVCNHTTMMMTMMMVIITLFKGYKRSNMRIAIHENPSQSCRASPAMWDHMVLPATRHRWTHATLAPVRLILDLLTPDGWKAEFNLGGWLHKTVRRPSPIEVLTVVTDWDWDGCINHCSKPNSLNSFTLNVSVTWTVKMC